MRSLRCLLVLGLPLLVLQVAVGVRGDSGLDPLRVLGLAFGVVGVFLLHRILDELEGATVAFWTSGLLLYATVLSSYGFEKGTARPALGFLAAAAVLAVWWPARHALRPGRGMVLGSLLGLCTGLNPLLGVMLVLPAATVLLGARRETGKAVRTGVLVLVAFAVAAPLFFGVTTAFAPQVVEAAQGSAFLNLRHPHVLLTFFSSRYGVLYGTPVLWGGFLGFFLLFRRDRFVALALGVPLLLLSYLHSCAGVGARGAGDPLHRFDSALPLLALGLGAAVAWVRDAVRRRPLRLAWVGAFFFVLWNQLLILQYREGTIPADDTVSFASVTENNARIFARHAGTPLAWPANWIFARAHELPPARYDLLAGKSLFDGPDPRVGLVAVGDPRADPVLFAGAWSAPVPCGAALCREVRGRARVLLPLGEPEELDVVVHASGRGTLSLTVNGVAVAAFPLETEPRDLRVRVPLQGFRAPLNDVVVEVGAGGAAFVERLAFERTAETRLPGERAS